MGCTAPQKKASLVGAFFVSVFYLTSAQAFCPAPAELPTFKVQRVVDGDTLRLVDGRSVRLIGVNAPELGRKGRPAEPYAEAARQRLQTLVAASDGHVGLQVGLEARDRYGRVLAHAYDSQGGNLEAQLLAEGLGYLVAVAPNVALVTCQRSAERSARQTGSGLWRQPPLRTPEQLKSGGFALIRAKVERVDRNRGGLWLELGGSLVAHVDAQALPDFDVRKLQGLSGRTVEVRGWVVDRARRGSLQPGRSRWLLPLTHNAMLEVIR
ncbi:thermonuclease family protein [Pseudomonas borbori]